MDLKSFQSLFHHEKPLIGMVHLQPLPASPKSNMTVEQVIDHALQDVQALMDGGMDGLILENYGDVPFTGGQVGPETVAAMTLAAHQIRKQCQCPIGINVLRNDSRAALAIASILKCDFIRVNVYMGVVATDQGLIEGKAFETLRYRAILKSPVKIFADVFVKHGHTLDQSSISNAAVDGVTRGLADGIIITGGATGQAVKIDDLIEVKQNLPNTPVIAGSGVTSESLLQILPHADAFIVGTSLKNNGLTENSVDALRVQSLVHARDEWLASQAPIP